MEKIAFNCLIKDMLMEKLNSIKKKNYLKYVNFDWNSLQLFLETGDINPVIS